MSAWFNYTAVFQIIVAGLLVGAGLPALFALAVRMNAAGSGVVGHEGGAAVVAKPFLSTISWIIFGAVLLVVIAGVLFIARDLIGGQTGMYLFGAKPK